MRSDLWWLSLPLFPLFVVYLVKCRSQREALRAGSRVLRELTPADRREIARAVRQGRAVADPRQAGAAVIFARGLCAKCRLEVVLAIAVLGVEAARALLLLIEVRLEALALQLLWLDAFALLVAFVSQTRRRAQDAERATLRLQHGMH